MTALVLGHKNPDTDSIVSALSATYLYRARGIDAVSGAQGDPSPETAFVLKRFGLKAPEVVHSVEGREVYLDATPRDLVFRDYKDFDMNGKKVGIGQLSLISLDLITPELKAQLAAELKEVKAEGRDTVLLVLTDIMKEGSELLMESDDADIVRGALKPDANGWMAGVMSRKKQVVPPLQLAFKA